MKTLFFTLLLMPFLGVAQSQKNIELFKKSVLYSKYFQNEISESEIKNLMKEYECVQKKYNFKIYEDPAFLNEDEYLKKHPEDYNFQRTDINSFFVGLQLKNYDYRQEVQKKYSKCISKKSIDW